MDRMINKKLYKALFLLTKKYKFLILIQYKVLLLGSCKRSIHYQ